MYVIKRCKDAGIESVYNIMEMEDDKRTALLRMDANKTSVNSTTEIIVSNIKIYARRDVATFVDSYPALGVNPEV
jgi:pre-mRNA-splicing helicase BRR2